MGESFDDFINLCRAARNVIEESLPILQKCAIAAFSLTDISEDTIRKHFEGVSDPNLFEQVLANPVANATKAKNVLHSLAQKIK